MQGREQFKLVNLGLRVLEKNRRGDTSGAAAAAAEGGVTWSEYRFTQAGIHIIGPCVTRRIVRADPVVVRDVVAASMVEDRNFEFGTLGEEAAAQVRATAARAPRARCA